MPVFFKKKKELEKTAFQVYGRKATGWKIKKFILKTQAGLTSSPISAFLFDFIKLFAKVFFYISKFF